MRPVVNFHPSSFSSFGVSGNNTRHVVATGQLPFALASAVSAAHDPQTEQWLPSGLPSDMDLDDPFHETHHDDAVEADFPFTDLALIRDQIRMLRPGECRIVGDMPDCPDAPVHKGYLTPTPSYVLTLDPARGTAQEQFDKLMSDLRANRPDLLPGPNDRLNGVVPYKDGGKDAPPQLVLFYPNTLGVDFASSLLVDGQFSIHIADSPYTKAHAVVVNHNAAQWTAASAAWPLHAPSLHGVTLFKSGAGVADLMETLRLVARESFVIGEFHDRPEQEAFLVSMLPFFAGQGVRTLYPEGLYNPVVSGAESRLMHELAAPLGQHSTLIERAKACAVRPVGIEGFHTDQMTANTDLDPSAERVPAFNFVAARNMRADQQKNPGKFIVFCGLDHAKYSEDTRVPGLAVAFNCRTLHVCNLPNELAGAPDTFFIATRDAIFGTPPARGENLAMRRFAESIGDFWDVLIAKSPHSVWPSPT